MRLRARETRAAHPISAIRENVVFGSGTPSAVYRVETISFDLLPLAEKQVLHGRFSRWMMEAEADFSIWRACRECSADHYRESLADDVDERYSSRARWEAKVDERARVIESMGAFEPEIYFAVSLQPNSRMPWARTSKNLHDLSLAEQATLDLLSSYLPARRATTLELQWLEARTATRGVNEPDLDPHWSPPALSLDGGVWEPGRADVQTFQPVVQEHGRSVLVQGEDGESLQAFLTLGKNPKRSEFPGPAEILSAPLERLDFPVDVVTHVRWVSNKKMLTICDNAVKESADESEDAAARYLSKSVKQRSREIESIHEYFASEPYPPGLDVFTSLAVAAPADNLKLLDQRVKRLKGAYPVKLYRPFGLQTDLFAEHLLRPDGAASRDYRRGYKRLMAAEQLAGMMVLAANLGGSRTGFVIGETYPGVRRPVRYDPRESIRREETGTVFMNGTLGSAKTVSAQFLAYLADHAGAVVVDIDPKKPESDHSLERWPGMEGRVEEIVINNVDEHRGQLDPLVFAPPDMREELGSEYLMDIPPKVKDEWQTEIVDAVRFVLREESPCLAKVVRRLLSSEDEHAHSAGRALNTWSDWGLGKLAFGDGERGSTDVQRSVTMIKAPTLTLPVAGTPRSSYSHSERVGVATFKLIIARAMRMLAGVDRDVVKVLVIDEVHVFTPSPEGRAFLQTIIRMARFMGIIVVLASQLPGDLGELEELIGVHFVFRQQTSKQALLNLQALGLISPDKEKLDHSDKSLISKLLTLEKGCCLMRGLDGRVVQMRFDPGQEILGVATTDPSRSRQQIEDLEQALAV